MQIKENFQKLVEFVKNPSKFYKKNADEEKSLLDFMAFILRLSFALDFIIGLISAGAALTGTAVLISAIVTVFLILIARIFAIIGLAIGSWILNLFVKLFSKADNKLAAKRVVTFAYVTMIIGELQIPYITALITLTLTIILYTLGISKQYKLPTGKSFWITIAALFIPTIILILIAIGLILLVYGAGFFPGLLGTIISQTP